MGEVIDLAMRRAAKENGCALFMVRCATCAHRWVLLKPNAPPFEGLECHRCGAASARAVTRDQWEQ